MESAGYQGFKNVFPLDYVETPFRPAFLSISEEFIKT